MKPALVPAAVSNGERLARRALGCALDEDLSTDNAAALLLELAACGRATPESALEEIDRRVRIETATANPLIVERAAQAIRIALQKSDAVDADGSEQAHQRH